VRVGNPEEQIRIPNSEVGARPKLQVPSSKRQRNFKLQPSISDLTVQYPGKCEPQRGDIFVAAALNRPLWFFSGAGVDRTPVKNVSAAPLKNHQNAGPRFYKDVIPRGIGRNTDRWLEDSGLDLLQAPSAAAIPE
jgi:hypothetical protein